MTTQTATDQRLVCWLDSTPALEELGGKARGLARLAAAGLPVPAGFVLPADILPAPPEPAPGEEGLPEAVVHTLTEAYAELGRRIGEPDPPVAVRSSGLAEDLAHASFAGQYVTVLGARGEAELLVAARRCWASLWSPGVAAYRAAIERRTGETLPPPGMALLVQALVPADAAGVAETAAEEVTVSAAWGLGRAVVEGAVEPDIWRVARSTLTVSELRTGDKHLRAAAGLDAGFEPVPEPQRHHACLTPEQAEEVARLALQAEAVIGCAADVEWALADETIWLLQARPLTGRGGPEAEEVAAPPGPIDPSPTFPFTWPDTAARGRHWSQGAEDGRLFEALPPMEIDTRLAFLRGMAWAEWQTGAPETSAAMEVNGYLYYARVPAPDEEARARRAADSLRPVRALHARGETLFGTALIPEVQEGVRRLDAVRQDELPHGKLAAHLEEMLRWYEHTWSLHFSMDSWEGASPIGRCAAIYRDITGDETPWAVFAPFAHAPQQEHEAVAGLIALARLAQESPALRALLSTREPAEALTALPETEGGAAFLARLEALLIEFGLHSGASQGVLVGQVLPGWRDEPWRVLALVQRYLPQDLTPLEQAYQSSKDQYARDVAGLRARVAERATPEQLAEFERWFTATERMVITGLNHNHHIDSPANALMHRAIAACGRRLVAAGALDDPGDVWWLRRYQAAAALRSLETPGAPDWRSLVRAARELHTWQRSLTPPPHLGAPPRREEPPPAHSGDAEVLPPNLLLRGTPAVPGVATGRVRLVDHHALVPDIQPGDVFVAADCGVLWAVLLPVAAAVVLDGSNPHEHAMRVCRDFGVPGVVQAREATLRLREGQQVTVDGGRGWVLA
ncbi:MAG: hypothetical protein RLZZ387_2217 [Chloroflexota bacterium]|jgi:pyruvate,water dikinase